MYGTDVQKGDATIQANSTLTSEYEKEANNVKESSYGTEIPQHEIENLARALLPTIQAFFETEKGKREFAEWKRKQADSKEA